MQRLQSTVAVSQSVPALPLAIVGVPFGQVQVFAIQETVLNRPLVPHVTVPLPVYPVLQVTVRLVPVVPVILPSPALSEFATLPESAQELATQDLLLRVYPLLHNPQ